VKRRRVPVRTRAPAAPAQSADAKLGKIYEVVRSIPRGKVATYGEIAELAGIPSGHRVAARAMRVCPSKLPWQRVVGKKDARRAAINIEDEEHAELQRMLLEAEGVIFDANGYIPLRRSGWLHASAESARKRRSKT
jgi:methylated-DNA-protein-cysteine methyltransferase related protein